MVHYIYYVLNCTNSLYHILPYTPAGYRLPISFPSESVSKTSLAEVETCQYCEDDGITDKNKKTKIGTNITNQWMSVWLMNMDDCVMKYNENECEQ